MDVAATEPLTLPVVADKGSKSVRVWGLDDPLDPRAAYAMCEGVAFGRSLHELELEEGMPPKDLFVLWVMKHPPLALAFNRAREMSSYVMEEEAINLLRGKLKAPGTQQELKAAQLLVEQLRWSAIKRNPQTYSDKAAVNVTVPIQINTSLDLGNAQVNQGTKEFPNIYEMRATITELVDVPQEPETATIAKAEGIAKPKKRRMKERVPGAYGKKRVLVPRLALTDADRQRQEEAKRLHHERLLARQAATRRRVAKFRAKQKDVQTISPEEIG